MLLWELMWDVQDGLFYGSPLSVRSPGKGSVPWPGRSLPCSPASPIANRPRAFAIISGCSRGSFWLLTCDHDYGYRDRQWNYPVGWRAAPLDRLPRGLKDYGYKEDASRIAMKWID